MQIQEIERHELPDPRDVVRVGGRDIGRWPVFHMFFLVLSAVVVGNGLIILGTVDFKVKKEPVVVGATPAQRFVPLDPDSPRLDPTDANVRAVVVIAHDLAGSQQLMWPFASTFARNGYAAETFDWPGHGRAPTAFTADDGQQLGVLDSVVRDARQRWPGKPIVLLGAGMGAQAALSYAHLHHDIAATIAVSSATEALPDVHNVLLVDGAWASEAAVRRAQAARTAGRSGVVEPERTSGSFGTGTARRLEMVPLAGRTTIGWQAGAMRASVAWVDELTGTMRTAAIGSDVRMLGVGVVVAGLVWFWWSLCPFVFRRRPPPAAPPVGVGTRLLLIGIVTALVTPLILWPLPIDNLLPLAGAAYLAAHFCLFGLFLVAACRLAGGPARPLSAWTAWREAIGGMLLLVGIVTVGLGTVTQQWWLNVFPSLPRIGWACVLFVLLLPLAAGEALYVGSESGSRRRLAGIKACLLGSLALGVMLRGGPAAAAQVLPLVAVSLVLFGVMGLRLTERTGNPLPGALATAATTAWLLAATLPLVR